MCSPTNPNLPAARVSCTPTSGYTIAGHIAETIAGEPYEALIQNRVFLPLRLPSAGFGPPRGEYTDQEPVGHAVLLLGSLRVRVPIDPFKMRADNSPLIAPAGTVHMTIRDLSRYGAIHQSPASTGATRSCCPSRAGSGCTDPFLDDYARGWVRQERDW